MNREFIKLINDNYTKNWLIYIAQNCINKQSIKTMFLFYFEKKKHFFCLHPNLQQLYVQFFVKTSTCKSEKKVPKLNSNNTTTKNVLIYRKEIANPHTVKRQTKYKKKLNC